MNTTSRLLRPKLTLNAAFPRSCLSARLMSSRAVVFTSNGNPTKVVQVVSFPDQPHPPPNSVNIRFVLSPINPSDINVIEGVYPVKPEPRTNIAESGPGSKEEPCFMVGNEGLAEVTEIGQGVSSLVPGDRVVMVIPQSGTWSSGATVQEQDVIKIPILDGSSVSDVQGATMSVCISTI